MSNALRGVYVLSDVGMHTEITIRKEIIR